MLPIQTMGRPHPASPSASRAALVPHLLQKRALLQPCLQKARKKGTCRADQAGDQ